MKSMKVRLYNTLTRKKDEVEPLEGKLIKLYTCGPTVYGPGHLGHARSYTSFDLLKRVLLYNDFIVNHVLNITDIHDDMIKKADQEGVTIQELADRYIPLFKNDLDDLNILPADEYPRVTEYIDEIIEFIEILVEKEYAYVEEDGSVYYDVSKFKDYGKLSGVKLEEAKTGTRVETDKYDRKSPVDFSLWKGKKEGEPSWSSPWGEGRPGWHIECSVMAKECLADTIDIHGGALDLKFPHHENEIAQSEAANEAPFAKIWFHGGLLDIEDHKMSKSMGNYIEIHEIKDKGFDPLALRYLFLGSHYRTSLNFTWDSLEGAQNALNNLRSKIREIKSQPSQVDQGYRKRFLERINDDLDIPGALAITWKLVKDEEVEDDKKYTTLLNFDKVLGLRLDKVKRIEIPQEVQDLIKERESLRQDSKFKEADEIRKKVEKMGYEIEDTEEGPKIKKQDA